MHIVCRLRECCEYTTLYVPHTLWMNSILVKSGLVLYLLIVYCVYATFYLIHMNINSIELVITRVRETERGGGKEQESKRERETERGGGRVQERERELFPQTNFTPYGLLPWKLFHLIIYW